MKLKKENTIEDFQVKSLEKDTIKTDEFTSAFEYASIGIGLVSLEGRFLKVNKSLCELLGYTAEEFIHLTFQEITHPDDLEGDLENVYKLINDEIENYQIEKRYFTKSGNVIWINLSGSKVKNLDGTFKYFIAQIENITPRKNAFNQITKQNLRIQNILEGTNAGTWEWNVQTGETNFNARWAEMIGYTLEELEPINIKTWEKFVHPEDALKSEQNLIACFEKKSQYYNCECRMQHKDGNWIWVLDRGKVMTWTEDGKPLMMFGTHTEITNLKETKIELRKSKAFLDTVMNSIDVGIVVCDQNGKLTTFNQSAEEMQGIPFKPVESKDWSANYSLLRTDGITPLPLEEIPLYRALKNGHLENAEFIIQHQSGKQIILSCNGNQIWDQNKNLLGAVVAMTDITEIKKATKLNEEIAIKFKGIFDSTFQFIGFLSPDGTLLEANQTAIDFTGLEPDDLIGKKFWDCYWWSMSEETQEGLKSNIAKAAKGEFVQYEVEVLGKNGSITILFNLKPLFDLSGEVIAIIPEGRPIQEIVDTRNALLRKNEELERFASVASHDLKEPLRMISSFMSLLKKNYGGQIDEKAEKYIHFSIDAANRMTILINDLLNYAKIGNDEVPFVMIDTNQLLEEIVPLFSASLEDQNGKIEIENLPNIIGKITPIKTLFQNLIGNALKYQKPNTSPLIRVKGKEKMSDWEFCVEDNGIGIAAHHFEEIFQMFRRLHSKEEYSGTGMGLATCNKIIKQHGGEIWLESEEEKGSKFFFTIKK
ncbi:PAS domain S-box protein [Aquiflexum sp.]|uniref:PAS domain S-box protein n=1 Tax=Aquiflexum sp. TaxID=1872584 RepID=UPI00359463ED